MATQDKERIAARIEMPPDQCKFPRILIATDAYGLGIEYVDVMRVTHSLLPSSMAKLYQRLVVLCVAVEDKRILLYCILLDA